MSHAWTVRHFSQTFQECRSRFLAAAERAGAELASHVLPGLRGAEGEPLATDIAYLGPPEASRLLILSSGTHGPEGYAGSACQTALLHDEALLTSLRADRVGLLLIHAINPYGFSHAHRTNEDNIDLNRNAVEFPIQREVSSGYLEAHDILAPANWPHTAAQKTAIAAYCTQQGGTEKVWKILSQGQYQFPGKLFYGGQAESWSVAVLREVLGQYTRTASAIAWIDVHTGLGPYGHGEKICPVRPHDRPLARNLWGSDILVPGDGGSVSAGVSGSVLRLLHQIRPDARIALMGLEFGTKPCEAVMQALVADLWVRNQPQTNPTSRQEIATQVRNAFYCDADDWKGAVLGQMRVALLQSAKGLPES